VSLYAKSNYALVALSAAVSVTVFVSGALAVLDAAFFAALGCAGLVAVVLAGVARLAVVFRAVVSVFDVVALADVALLARVVVLGAAGLLDSGFSEGVSAVTLAVLAGVGCAFSSTFAGVVSACFLIKSLITGDTSWRKRRPLKMP